MGPECRGEASSDFHSGIDHALTIRVRKVVVHPVAAGSLNVGRLRLRPVSCVGHCGALMARGDFTRWLYRGQQPTRLAGILNRASAVAGSVGGAPNYLVTLEVRGHKSGRVIFSPPGDGRRGWPALPRVDARRESGLVCECAGSGGKGGSPAWPPGGDSPRRSTRWPAGTHLDSVQPSFPIQALLRSQS
jgi:hypothetical protein